MVSIIWQYESMKQVLFLIFLYLSALPHVRAFTGDIGKTSYTFDVESIFPAPQRVPGNKGIDNVIEYIVSMIPLLTTLMAV
jgi:hypothetical protein